ncbi:MAG: S8 family peptidase [Ignavibacteria bacterium]|nr:S8 family peptidase [Ignavibacteria bacterium]
MKTTVFVLLVALCATVYSNYTDNNYVKGEVIIMLKPGELSDNLTKSFGFINLRVKESVVDYMNIWLFEYDDSKIESTVILTELRKNRYVAIAQMNHYINERSVVTPNDPSFGLQWGMNNTGQTIQGSPGTPDADIDAPEAWGLNTSGLTAAGDTIVVAIVDGGFYLTHPDIKFWKNYNEIPSNGIDDDLNGYIDDVNGWNAVSNNGNLGSSTHGSHCSGIAGARGNNSLGVSGVNWNVQIMGVQGSTSQEVVALRAYGYCLKQRMMYNQTNGLKGAFVVVTSSSFGVDYGQPANYPLWCAFYDSLGVNGILSAGATANLNINIDNTGDIPTACPSDWLITVTNTTNTDAKNSGAAYGLTTIDLGAPGTNVYSTTSAGNYANMTGTSMATPHVAGAVAFMYSVAPLSWIQQYKLTPGPYALQVKQNIMQGVDIKPSMVNTVSGGRLNLYNSALLMQNLTPVNGNNSEVPVNYKLYQNYPNPFNPTTVITFDMPKEGFASLKIYNALGQEVAVLAEGIIQAGIQHKVFNAQNLPSGIYFYKLITDGFTDVKKMSLIK